ncbi:MAG: type II CAAX endopeptidase family protein [Bryobacteraceae bacterium]
MDTEFPPATETPPVRPREPFWDYVDLLLVGGLCVASALIILLMAAGLATIHPAFRKDPTPLALPLQIVFYVLIYLAFKVTFLVRHNAPVFKSLGWREVQISPLLLALGGVLLALGVSAIAALLHTPQVKSPFDKLLGSWWMVALLVIFAIFLGPISEELVFRGFLQPLLSRTFGVAAGISLTAATFGCLHGPEYSWAWQYVLAVSLAGAVFGVLRATTNSIIPSTIMHGAYNALFVVAMIAQKYGKFK